MGALPNVYPGYQSVADEKAREKFEATWGAKLNPSIGKTLTEIIPAAASGQIKAVYLMGENPYLNGESIRLDGALRMGFGRK